MRQLSSLRFPENAVKGETTEASEKWGNFVTNFHIQENLIIKKELLITT